MDPVIGENEYDLEAIMALWCLSDGGDVTVRCILTVCEQLKIPVRTIFLEEGKKYLGYFQTLGNNCIDLIRRCHVVHLEKASTLITGLISQGGGILGNVYPNLKGFTYKKLQQLNPLLITYRGPLGLLEEKAVAVVGSTKPSQEASKCVERITKYLINEGYIIVSGGAPGVDTIAHKVALECGGKTIVVLPQGLFTFGITLWMQRGLESGQVLLLSQFPPDSIWKKHAAVRRNVTIANLSEFVCAIEPGRLYGSVKTAESALQEGKLAFVLYTGINSMVERLRQQGAFVWEAKKPLDLIFPTLTHDSRVTRLTESNMQLEIPLDNML